MALSWLTINPTSGNGGEATSVVITPTVHTGRNNRSGVLTITYGENTKDFPITQSGAALYAKTTTASAIDIPSSGGTFGFSGETNGCGAYIVKSGTKMLYAAYPTTQSPAWIGKISGINHLFPATNSASPATIKECFGVSDAVASGLSKSTYQLFVFVKGEDIASDEYYTSVITSYSTLLKKCNASLYGNNAANDFQWIEQGGSPYSAYTTAITSTDLGTTSAYTLNLPISLKASESESSVSFTVKLSARDDSGNWVESSAVTVTQSGSYATIKIGGTSVGEINLASGATATNATIESSNDWTATTSESES